MKTNNEIPEQIKAYRKGYTDSVNDILDFIKNEIKKIEKINENDIQIYNMKNLELKIKIVFSDLF